MAETLLVIHIIIAVALVILVLLQRSEGGALGIGGNSAGGNLFTGRGMANTLTRLTAILAVGFFLTSIGLTIFSTMQASDSVLDDYAPDEGGVIEAPAPALPPDFTPRPQDNRLPPVPSVPVQ